MPIEINSKVLENPKAFNLDMALAVQRQLPRAVGEVGLRSIKRQTGVFRNPTGNFVAHLQLFVTDRQALVTDSNIIYGWWLERGHRRTIFRGYQIWAKAVAWLEPRVADIAETKLAPFVARWQ